MRKILPSVLTVVAISLACSTGPSQTAIDECTPPSEATDCEKCFLEKCQDECYACVDDADGTCYGCMQGTEPESTCMSDEQVALFVTCVLTADCATQCAGQPPPDKGRPPRAGKGRKGGGGGRDGKGGGGGRDGKGGDGDRDGKGGKGGKH